MKVKLLFPPKWCYSQPYLSLPSLTAVLRNQGIHVEQIDLNIQSFYYILNKERLTQKVDEALAKNSLEQWPEKLQPSLRDTLAVREYILNNLDSAMEQFTSFQCFEDYQSQKNSLFILENALHFYSLPLYPEKIELNYYSSKYDWSSSIEILKALENPQENLYYDFYQSQIPEIIKDCDFIGISIVGLSQIIPGLVLAGMIKSKAPHIHICIGGPIFTVWSAELDRLKPLFTHIDSVIVYEGEYPLLRLIQALQTGEDLHVVPNLIYCHDNELMRTEIISPPIFNDLPTPDFTGFPLDDYLAPTLVLPLLASRGCYWRKCTFCSHSHIYGGRYDIRSAERIKEDLRILVEKHNVKYINFSDESISPALLRQIGRSVLDSGLEVYWSCDMRFEKSLSEEIIDEAFRGGLRAFYFGLESYNDRIRNLMQKGTTREDISRILEYAHRKGIYNHLFFIMGFPTETQEDLEETLQFLRENTHYTTAGGANFSLPKNSPIACNPLDYKVNILPSKHDLELTHTYSCDEGLNCTEIHAMYKNFSNKDILGEARTNFNKSISRDLWLVYAANYQLENIENYCVPMLAPFDLQRPIKLKIGVYYMTTNEQVWVFDILTSQKYMLTLDSKIILDLLAKEPLTPVECMAQITAHFGWPAGSLDADILPMLEDLYNKNLFSVM